MLTSSGVDVASSKNLSFFSYVYSVKMHYKQLVINIFDIPEMNMSI